MNVLMLYIAAIGVGMLGCLASVSVNKGVNKIASISHYAGLFLMSIYAMMCFGFLHMLGVLATILVVGMALAYLVMKSKKK